MKQHPGGYITVTSLLHQCFILGTVGADVKIMKHPGGHDIGGPDVLKSIAKFILESIPS